ncbi:hypothetical protein V7S43_011440 [Phytophthora oleae]|uniref:Uncharacterized protein n=1 Tax=Phytophthora oleae TaxID=2107226 RepID=A0ABD3F9Z5_9STRA
MKCAKSGCSWSNLEETSPCSVCARPVNHLCSNELCVNAELSKRFCSRRCVKRFFENSDLTPDSMTGTPSSMSGISASSQATVIDLRQRDDEGKSEANVDEEEKTESEITNVILKEIGHGPEANDFIWKLIHKLEKKVPYKGKEFTHICLECLKTRTWRESLCKCRHTSNAKAHFVTGLKTNYCLTPC